MKFKIITVTLNPSIDITMWTDSLVSDHVNRVTNEITSPGGKGINVSRVLTRTQIPTMALGIGGAENLQSLTMPLSDEGVVCKFVHTNGNIRNNLTINTKEETYKINRQGFSCSCVQAIKLANMVAQQTNTDDIIVFGGTIPTGIDKSDFLSIVQSAKEANARIVIDCSFLNARDLYSISPFIVATNLYDFANLANCDVSTLNMSTIFSIIKGLCKDGIENILVSLGPKGVIFANSKMGLYVSVPEVDMKSSVGSVDSGLAGFLTAYYKGGNFKKCAAYAAAYQVASTMEEPTKLANPEEAEKLLSSIRIFEK